MSTLMDLVIEDIKRGDFNLFSENEIIFYFTAWKIMVHFFYLNNYIIIIR